MSSSRTRWHQMVSNQIPQTNSGLFGCFGAAASVADGRKDSAYVLSQLHPSDSVLTVSMLGMRWINTRSTDITPDIVIENATDKLTDAGRRGSEGKGAEGNSAERYEGKQPTLVNKLDSRSQVPVNGRRKGRG
jgi:hypothetical protein